MIDTDHDGWERGLLDRIAAEVAQQPPLEQFDRERLGRWSSCPTDPALPGWQRLGLADRG